MFGGRFARKLASLQRTITQGQLLLDQLQQRVHTPEHLARQTHALTELRAAHTGLLQGPERDDAALHALSLCMHPFRLNDQHPQTTAKVATAMTVTLATLRALAGDDEITDSKARLTNVQKQVPDIAALVDVWWRWVTGKPECLHAPAGVGSLAS